MGSVGLILVMTGNEVYAAKGHGIAALASLVLNLALTYYVGLKGAAIATAITVVLWNVLLAMWVHRKLGLHPMAFARASRGGSDA